MFGANLAMNINAIALMEYTVHCLRVYCVVGKFINMYLSHIILVKVLPA